MKVGDLVVVLYEKKYYSLIVGSESDRRHFFVFFPNGNVRSVHQNELRKVKEKEHEN